MAEYGIAPLSWPGWCRCRRRTNVGEYDPLVGGHALVAAQSSSVKSVAASKVRAGWAAVIISK